MTSSTTATTTSSTSNSNYSSSHNPDPGYILYVDHQGHPAPLTECFYATASRRLSSTIDRVGRSSTITHIDSAFCPQCLSFHDASSASQLGYCPQPSCLLCPLCQSIVSGRHLTLQQLKQEDDQKQKQNNQVFGYACGQCDWTSMKCHLTVDVTTTTKTGEKADEVVKRGSEKVSYMSFM